jgi:ankyrin repeat protein
MGILMFRSRWEGGGYSPDPSREPVTIENAIQDGRLALARRLLELASLTQKQKDDILHQCVRNANVEAMRLLIEFGANAKNSNLLYSACCFNIMGSKHKADVLNALRVLLDNGADPNQLYVSMTPLSIAANNRNHGNEVMTLLVERGAVVDAHNNVAIRTACEQGNWVNMRYLLSVGADVHVNNDAILLQAIKANCPDIVKELTDTFHATPTGHHLETAVQYCPSVVSFLLQKGVNPRSGSNQFMINYGFRLDVSMAFFAAVKCNNIDVVRNLVDAGAEPNARDNEALFLAADTDVDDTTVLRYLLDKGCDIHAHNDSALRTAVRKNHIDKVAYLVSKGANVCANDDEAIIMSVSGYTFDKNMFKLLVKHGANIHARNDTVLAIAAKRGHRWVVDYLEPYHGF